MHIVYIVLNFTKEHVPIFFPLFTRGNRLRAIFDNGVARAIPSVLFVCPKYTISGTTGHQNDTGW